jgi:hypothetical protein
VSDDLATAVTALCRHGVPVPARPEPLSALIATYNRCPFGATGRMAHNPLAVTLTTLLADEAVTEVVVVDDGSTDASGPVLDAFARRFGPRLRATRLDRHRGAAAARNAALRLARHRTVLVLDDDMVVAPGSVAAAAAQFAALCRADPRAGALTLPYYTRRGSPRTAVPAASFGNLDLDNGYFTSNFDCYPAERLAVPAFDDTGLVSPLRTSMVSGFCLLAAGAVADVGGYADLTGWTTSYSDHLTLAADLTAAGWHLYHNPDPRLAAIHLKFGARGRYAVGAGEYRRPIPALRRSLGSLIEMAADPRVDTGCRTTDDGFAEEMIGLFFACYATRSRTGGRAWATRSYRDYVCDGVLYTDAYAPAEGRRVRVEQWRRGLVRGARFAAAGATGEVSACVLAQLRDACTDVAEPVDIPW